MARQFTSRGSRLSRRWLGFNSGQTFHALSAGSLGLEIASESTVKDTIMRTRGQLVCWVDATQEPPVSAIVSVGLHIVPEGTDATVLTEPFADSNADWFYYTEFVVGHEELVTNVVEVAGLSIYRETIDDKAMRIGKPDTQIQMVVTNTTLAGAVSVNVTATGRFLLGS